jgi:hypothetical protein
MVAPHPSESDGGFQVTFVPHEDAGAETVILEGQSVTNGGARSLTTTLNEHVDLFPARSVAV